MEDHIKDALSVYIERDITNRYKARTASCARRVLTLPFSGFFMKIITAVRCIKIFER